LNSPAPPIQDDARFLAYARLMDEGRYFEAHEVLEAFWLVAPEAQRDLLQGLVQVAVACEHRRRGNPPGARKVLDRARARIARVPEDEPAWRPLLRATEDYIEGVTASLGFRFHPVSGP
jgi:predicted metal-dependent hydrolase